MDAGVSPAQAAGSTQVEAFDAWYDADYDCKRSLTESPFQAIRRAFLAAYDIGAAAEREAIIQLAISTRALAVVPDPELPGGWRPRGFEHLIRATADGRDTAGGQ